MFFYLSKILYFLLVPANWLLACALGYVIFKSAKVKKRFLISGIAIFIIFSNSFLYRICTLAWQPKPAPIHYTKTYSTGIVLCGMTMADKHQQRFFGGVGDRFIQTSRLYHTGVIKKIFVSGGTGSLKQTGPKEAEFLRNEFLAQGVPDSAIFIEEFSRNTYESAVAAKHILDSVKLQPPFVLITSAIHMPRSVKAFEKAGIPVVQHPASFEVLESDYGFLDSILPDLNTLNHWKYLLKEMVGMAAYKLTGKL
jgi:uncharacterized SAM-binding protein YcdF (DUF218 family)